MGVCHREADGGHRRLHDRTDHDWAGDQPMDGWDFAALFAITGTVSALVAHALVVAARSVGSFT